jgi:phenylacetate-CoA ligase
VRLKRITGRNDDMLIIRGVNVYPSQIEAVLVGLPGIEPHYQLVVERCGNMDELTIEVEGQADAAARVQHHVKSMIGISATVVVKKPGEVPRSQGKAVRVRDLRPKPL